MRLLIYTWLHEYTLTDIVSTLKEMNYDLSFFEYDLYQKNKSDNPEFYQAACEYLDSNQFDAAFSVNYFPDFAKACFEHNLTYISWTYDCPLDIVNIEDTLGLPTNRAFFFDRNQCDEFQSHGINTVFHLPLAVNIARLSTFSYSEKYASDISFVGNLYPSSYPTLSKYMNEYFTGYTRGLIEAQKNTYGAYLTKESLTDSFLKSVNDDLKKHNCPYSDDKRDVSKNQLAYLLASQATYENRMLCLGLLSKFNTYWYTSGSSDILPNISRKNPVDYLNEMPVVFKSSRINLHIGHHGIPSGISLRQLDILGCGGFLLSSFQPELFEYFVPGEDFDYFTCPQEAYEKSAFYLSHEDTRKNIAESGYKKVIDIFDYHTKLKELFDMALN